jgi:5,10-methylenetetrahydromethanopterin reductase
MGFAAPPERFDWAVQMVTGTVLDPGESPQSPRVVEAFGPWQVGMYHATWEMNRAAVPSLPGGQVWLDAIAAERPERERHLAVHDGHVTHLTAADRRALATFKGQIPWHGWVGEADAIRKRADEAAAAGTTELLYVPSGDDLIREAEAFFGALERARG